MNSIYTILQSPNRLIPQSLAQTVFEMSVLAPSFSFSILICWYIGKAVAPGQAKICNRLSIHKSEIHNPKSEIERLGG